MFCTVQAIVTSPPVAAVAGAAGGDVRQVYVGLGMGALDDGSQPKVAVTFQSSRGVRERRQAADRGVHASVVIIGQHLAVWIGDAGQTAVVARAFGVRVLHVRRLRAPRRDDGATVRLPFGDELAEAVEFALDLVNGGGGSG